MIGLLDHFNEAPRSKQRGIKAEFAEANPPSLFELRRATMPFIPAAPMNRDLCFAPTSFQGILAKANK
jgi:hypothetical protein